MLTDFYCQELLSSCTTGTAKWIPCHMDQAWNQCRLWSTIQNQYFAVPLLNLSVIFSVANCATYLSITSFLQLPSLVFTHASHLHSLGNLLSFHGLTQHCSFHSQHIFSHQLYQFLNTISIHPTLSAYGCIATNSSLTISLSKLFHCLLHSSLQTNTRLTSPTANGNTASYFTYPGFRIGARSKSCEYPLMASSRSCLLIVNKGFSQGREQSLAAQLPAGVQNMLRISYRRRKKQKHSKQIGLKKFFKAH